MSDTPAAWISAFSAFMSAVAAIAAVAVAIGSARMARAAQRVAEESEKRFVAREAGATAHAVLVQVRRARQLAEELKKAYRDSATLSGQAGGSREKVFTDRAEREAVRVENLTTEVEPVIALTEMQISASLVDLQRKHAELRRTLFEADTAVADLERELGSIASQCAERREDWRRVQDRASQ